MSIIGNKRISEEEANRRAEEQGIWDIPEGTTEIEYLRGTVEESRFEGKYNIDIKLKTGERHKISISYRNYLKLYAGLDAGAEWFNLMRIGKGMESRYNITPIFTKSPAKKKLGDNM